MYILCPVTNRSKIVDFTIRRMPVVLVRCLYGVWLLLVVIATFVLFVFFFFFHMAGQAALAPSRLFLFDIIRYCMQCSPSCTGRYKKFVYSIHVWCTAATFLPSHNPGRVYDVSYMHIYAQFNIENFAQRCYRRKELGEGGRGRGEESFAWLRTLMDLESVCTPMQLRKCFMDEI